MLSEIFQYGFMIRALEAGAMVALIVPLIGMFLVLRRYSLIADALAHVSLAGIAIGLFFGLNPILTALVTAVIASLGMERLRLSKKVYGESALALFLFGSLALSVVILSLARGLNANLFNYLFGSILTVTLNDIYIIAVLAVVVVLVLAFFYRALVYISFDEEAAKVSGLPVDLINFILIILAALTVALAIPIVGVLLIAALIVIPVITALQFRRSFFKTIVYAQMISLFSVLAGIFTAFFLDLSTGGTIVLIMLAIFLVVFSAKQRS